MLNYTVVNHAARKKLGLSMIEYCIADMIYNLSSDPRSPGWCFASKEWLAEMLGIGRMTTFRALSTLKQKGLIEKKSNKLRVTAAWYEEAIIKKESTTLIPKPYHNDTPDRTIMVRNKDRDKDITTTLIDSKKEEMRLESKFITSSTPKSQDFKEPIPPIPAAPLPAAPYKANTPVEKIRCYWKETQGIPYNDREWDRLYGDAHSKLIQKLLDYFKGNHTKVLDCIDALIKKFKEKNFEYSLETIVKWAYKWSAQQNQKETFIKKLSTPVSSLQSATSYETSY